MRVSILLKPVILPYTNDPTRASKLVLLLLRLDHANCNKTTLHRENLCAVELL